MKDHKTTNTCQRHQPCPRNQQNPPIFLLLILNYRWWSLRDHQILALQQQLATVPVVGFNAMTRIPFQALQSLIWALLAVFAILRRLVQFDSFPIHPCLSQSSITNLPSFMTGYFTVVGGTRFSIHRAIALDVAGFLYSSEWIFPGSLIKMPAHESLLRSPKSEQTASPT